MEVDGGATTITELPDLNPESIQIKPEFLDETDHVGFEDCKKEFGLENVPVSTELTNKETKHEGDWDMLEAEICEELIIKDEDEDISDINLALYSEDKTSKAGVLGANAYIDSLSAVSPKKEKIADQNAAGKDAATNASWSSVVAPFETVVNTEEEGISQTSQKVQKKKIFKCNRCPFSTVARFALDRHQRQHSKQSSRPCQESPINQKFSEISSISPSDNIFKYVDKEGLLKCRHPGCTFHTFNQRAFRNHHHNKLSSKAQKKTLSKVIKCQHCPAVLTRTSLLRHVLSMHRDQTIKCGKCSQRIPSQLKTYHRCRRNVYEKYNCMLCSFVTTEKKFFIKHMKGHETSQHTRPLTDTLTDKYNCYQCSYSSNARKIFTLHTKKHSSNLPIVKCKNCDYKSVRQAVRRHYFEAHCDLKTQSENLYKCDLCPYSQLFSSETQLKKHIDEHDDNLLVVKCHIAGCDFRSLRYIMAYHCTKTHGGIYKCKICTYTTKRIEDYTKHCHGHNKNSKSNKLIKQVFQCRVCPFSSMSRIKLEEHMVEHSIKANFLSCLHCSHIVQNLSDLIEHSVQKHPEYNRKCTNGLHTVPEWHLQRCENVDHATYKCQECSYSTLNETALTIHRRLHQNILTHRINRDQHTVVDTFKCKQCSYSTNSSSGLEGHMKLHLKGPIIVRCPHCVFRSTRLALRHHMNSIHGDFKEESNYKTKYLHKLHCCELCSYRTRNKYTFKNHSKLHLKNLRIEQCLYCDYKSTQTALWNHLKLTHKHSSHKKGEELNSFHCKLCSYSTSQKHGFQRHTLAHRKNLPIKQCPHCDFKSMQSALSYHIKTEHKSVNPQNLQEEIVFTGKPVTILYCKLCSYKSSDRSKLRNHELAHQKNYPIKQCPQCNFKSFSQVLTYHMAEHKSHNSKSKTDYATSGSDNIQQPQDEEVELSKKKVSERTGKISKKGESDYAENSDSSYFSSTTKLRKTRAQTPNELSQDGLVKNCARNVKLLNGSADLVSAKTASKVEVASWSFVVGEIGITANDEKKDIDGTYSRKNKVFKLLCRFKCDYCQFSTVTRFALDKHQAEHCVKTAQCSTHHLDRSS